MAHLVKQLDCEAEAPFELAEGVFALTTQGSISYLVAGEMAALVIDTGFGKVNVVEKARMATDKPLILVNTHGHGDHIGCNEMFEMSYAHPLEHQKIRRKNVKITSVAEGYVFNLGGRSLQVVEIPGHTPGSIALLEKESGFLFSGDMIGDRPLFLQFEYSDLDAYIASMDKLLAMRDKVNAVFCCHGTAVMDLEQAEKTKALALMIKENQAMESESVHLETEDGNYDAKMYSFNGAKIYY